MSRRLTTAEAAARLGVRPETLYSYVSRGRLGRRREAGGSTFDAAEVERLAVAGRRGAGEVGRGMAWVTDLTLIDDGRLWYRGVDATELAGRCSFEEVVEWLWTGAWPARPPTWEVPPDQAGAVGAVLAAMPAGAGVLDRFTVAVAAAAAADPLRHDLSAAAVASVGRRLLTILAGVLGAGAEGSGGVVGQVAPGVCGVEVTPERLGAIRSAMVLLADHELAASTLAARTAATFGADPYAVVGAGLGAASGARHAGASVEVQAMLGDAARVGAAVAVGERLRRHRLVPGFGQPLYPDGDPRGRALLQVVSAVAGDERRREVVESVLATVADRDVPAPNVDFGLAALMFALEAPVGAGEAVFVLARTAGWLAHAIEQYAEGGSFRVRATYTGPPPGQPPFPAP